jgi:hypothetical protein
MTRDVMRGVISRRNLSAFVVALLIGILHRGAETTPWADDRLMSADPGWLQLSSPTWHSMLEGSLTPSHALIRLVDPRTDASTVGDARAIAAVLASLTALALLALWRRLGVTDVAAIPLCLCTVAPTLPTAPATIVAHAIQMLAAAGMLLLWSAFRERAWYLPALTTLTIVGALNHFGLVAFAAGLWTAECLFPKRRSRVLTVTSAIAALLVGVVVSAAMLRGVVGESPAMGVPQPTIADLATGFVTGRFSTGLQPAAQGTLAEAARQCVPAPLILFVPLAALAFADHQTRRIAGGLTLSAACVLCFMANTWVPDLAVAAASGRIALLTLAGLGLSWLWVQGPRGSQTLAVLCGWLLAAIPFVTHVRGPARAATAEVESFVTSASLFVGDGYWSADRLSTTRALLARAPATLVAHRVEANVHGFARAPRHTRLIAFSGLSPQLIAPNLWVVPQQLAHANAATFVAALPDTRWLAIGLRGQASEGFCRALLMQAGIDQPTSHQLAVVVHPPDREPAVALGALDLPFGEAGQPSIFQSPAHFTIATDPAAQITINRRRTDPIADGMVLATFDTDTLLVHAWTVGPCNHPMLPPIEDRRLRATYVLEGNGAVAMPDVPVVSQDPVEVPLGDAGAQWFAAGWHAAEAPGAQALRWTGGQDALVNVVVSHQQSLRLRVRATLAQARTGTNSLTVLWNRSPLGPSISGAVDAEWIVPAAVVQRGVNVLTLRVASLVSPSELGEKGDRRLLGAAVSRISIVPIGSSTGADLPTSPR